MRLVRGQITSAVDWDFLAIRKTKSGVGHYMRRTRGQEGESKVLTEAELRGKTILWYVGVGSAIVSGGGWRGEP